MENGSLRRKLALNFSLSPLHGGALLFSRTLLPLHYSETTVLAAKYPLCNPAKRVISSSPCSLGTPGLKTTFSQRTDDGHHRADHLFYGPLLP